MSKIPNHIAIIMDGNRRWGKKNNVSSLEVYSKGADALANIIENISTFGFKYLTCFAFSAQNWSRSSKELDYLFSVLDIYLDKLLSYAHNKELKFLCLGAYQKFPDYIVQKISYIMDLTKSHDKYILSIALNYGSKEEIINGINSIIEDYKKGLIDLPITSESFETYLYTKDLPDVDLLLRTAGEKRLSNFMLWQCSYAEFVFLDELWPDFTCESLHRAIKIFSQRERRMGR